MSVTIGFGEFGATVPLQSLNGATSTGEGTRYVLPSALTNWGLQVKSASSSQTVKLNLGIATSSDATLTTVITWQSSSNGGGDATGVTKWSTAQYPATVAAIVLDTGASSGGCSAWFVGAP